jgi:bacterioferritin (cytochrome b1)
MRVESDDIGRGADADKIIDTLNKFLRGELSAVETYDQAIERLRGGSFLSELTDNQRSHQERAELLAQQVLQMGGEPSRSSGVWGGFAKLVEGGAKLFGEKAAVAALEEGEDHGMRLYRNELDGVDLGTRDLVERILLPEQDRTHRTMSAIKHRMHQ